MKRACLSQAQIEERLRAADISPTAQRLAVARFVLCEAEHPSAEEVKSWADAGGHKMSLATVYNTLGSLVKAGLLQEVRLPHTDKVLYDDRLEAHHHFIDEATGGVYDVPASAVRLSADLGSEFQVHSAHVVLRGSRKGGKS